MKTTLLAGALALACVLSNAARADEVCFSVETNIKDDNDRVVWQRVCVSDDRPAPHLKLIKERAD